MFQFLIVSKMASSSQLNATFGDQQGQTLQDYVEISVTITVVLKENNVVRIMGELARIIGNFF